MTMVGAPVAISIFWLMLLMKEDIMLLLQQLQEAQLLTQEELVLWLTQDNKNVLSTLSLLQTMT